MSTYIIEAIHAPLFSNSSPSCSELKQQPSLSCCYNVTFSHALLGSCAVSLLHVGADDVGVLEHAVVDGGEGVIVGNFAGGRVSAQRSSEE